MNDLAHSFLVRQRPRKPLPNISRGCPITDVIPDARKASDEQHSGCGIQMSHLRCDSEGEARGELTSDYAQKYSIVVSW